jgi:CRISPR/Cas system CSM-associated protein Csm2 small subunit
MFFSQNDDHINDNFLSFNDDETNEDEELLDDDIDEEDEEEETSEHDTEDLNELEKIESKLEAAISALESSQITKSQTIYSCPRCKKIYYNQKWQKDNITDVYTIHTELAYCQKCIGKTYENFIGSLEIFDKDLANRKEQFIDTIRRTEKALENTTPFEKIIEITEKNNILFVFANTTRLTQEIGKTIRQEFGGGIIYEWFERNQFLRVKWFDKIDNSSYFKERMKELKERRFGMFHFEDGD